MKITARLVKIIRKISSQHWLEFTIIILIAEVVPLVNLREVQRYKVRTKTKNPNIPIQVKTRVPGRVGGVLMKKMGEKGKPEEFRRKDSEDSFGLNVNNLEIFDKSKQQTAHRVC